MRVILAITIGLLVTTAAMATPAHDLDAALVRERTKAIAMSAGGIVTSARTAGCKTELAMTDFDGKSSTTVDWTGAKPELINQTIMTTGGTVHMLIFEFITPDAAARVWAAHRAALSGC